MLPNSPPHWCIIGIKSSPNKQVSSPSNTNARTRQHMQSSYPMHLSTLRNPWQRAQMRSTRRATINQHPLPWKDHHHQNSAETQTGEGCIPPSWQARPVGSARLLSGHNRLNAHMHRKLKFVPSPTCPCGEEDLRQPSMFFRYVTDTNQSESHSGHQQLRFTRNYMGAWRTWRRPPTSSLLLDWSYRRTRRRRRRRRRNN